MRRVIINLFISALTFGIGMGASALQSILTPSNNSAGPATPVATAPTESSTRQVALSCGCNQNKAPNEPDSIQRPADLTKGVISGGVLNGKAISLPKPQYPAVAKAARATGTVVVQITIDERGCVIDARAVSGHPLLQAAAEQAAWRACFSPTRLSGYPVKVRGVITYNFVL